MIESLKKIINPKVVLKIVDDSKVLRLKEDAEDSKIKELLIHNIPEKSFAFTLDKQIKKADKRCFKQLSAYIDPSNGDGVNKGCDLVVFFFDITSSKWKVLIFDLKSDKPATIKTEKQLMNSKIYVQYILSLIDYYYKGKVDDISKVEFKLSIVSTNTRGVSKNTVYKPNGEYLQPVYKTVFVTNVKEGKSSIYFQELIR